MSVPSAWLALRRYASLPNRRTTFFPNSFFVNPLDVPRFSSWVPRLETCEIHWTPPFPPGVSRLSRPLSPTFSFLRFALRTGQPLNSPRGAVYPSLLVLSGFFPARDRQGGSPGSQVPNDSRRIEYCLSLYFFPPSRLPPMSTASCFSLSLNFTTNSELREVVPLFPFRGM